MDQADFAVTGPGTPALEKTIPFEVSPRSEAELTGVFIIKNPPLWSAEEPRLYRLNVSINGELAGETNFGIRRVEITARRGFFVNGKSGKLKGVCPHRAEYT